MSHISTWKHKITNIAALIMVCKKLGYEFRHEREEFNVSMYGSQVQKGIACVKLPKWRYNLVIGKDGEIFYDHFGSTDRNMEQFGEFLQEYNETAIMETVDVTEWDSIETIVDENGEKEIIMTVY